MLPWTLQRPFLTVRFRGRINPLHLSCLSGCWWIFSAGARQGLAERWDLSLGQLVPREETTALWHTQVLNQV